MGNMSLERKHLKRLRKWASDMDAEEKDGLLSEMDRADLRALKWAVESLSIGIESMQEKIEQSTASYQSIRLNEFKDRRENRTALRALKRLRSIVTTVSNPYVLASVDNYLRQKHTALGNGTARPFLESPEKEENA